jgi:type III secretion protein Q
MFSQTTPLPLESSILRPLPRAVVEIRRSSVLREAGRELCAAVEKGLGEELDAAFQCQPRIMEALHRTPPLADGRARLLLSLANRGERAILEVEEGFAAAVVDRLAGAPVGAVAPGPLSAAEAAALGFLALCALRASRRASLIAEEWSVRLARVAATPAEAAEFASPVAGWLSIDLDLRLGQLAGEGRLLLPAGAAQSLARLVRRPCEAAAAAAVGACRLQGCLFAGQTQLNASDWQRLAPGDAVVLANLERLDGALAGPARLRFALFELHGVLSASGFRFSHSQSSHPPESAMPQSARPPPLPVELEIELTRLSLPISELGQLQPGAVLELNTRLDQPVLVRIGDRAVARAELVDIDGEIGARVLELLD